MKSRMKSRMKRCTSVWRFLHKLNKYTISTFLWKNDHQHVWHVCSAKWMKVLQQQMFYCFSGSIFKKGPSWPWLYGNWIYNYLWNQCPSPLMLWVRISTRARRTTLCDKDCQWLVTGRWFSPGTRVSSTNKTDRHDITEILLKVALNTIKQINNLFSGENIHVS
jgi:hypothetical protein